MADMDTYRRLKEEERRRALGLPSPDPPSSGGSGCWWILVAIPTFLMACVLCLSGEFDQYIDRYIDRDAHSEPAEDRPGDAPNSDLPADMQFMVGEWGGRYRSLVVNRDGTGEMRLLNPPDDPSKPAAEGDVTILQIRLETASTARVTGSNDAAVPAGARITIERMTDRGMLEITTPDRTWGTATYCNPRTAADPLACG
ncbi:hypothetical protein AB0C12_17190 [Actinoplanes sp. NPDC048967]|uniref:hypothetical protein n=1 Tax=Actinoplanes sp. NPDC048967 TaxID=3155269 RepID=UPI0033F066E0